MLNAENKPNTVMMHYHKQFIGVYSQSTSLPVTVTLWLSVYARLIIESLQMQVKSPPEVIVRSLKQAPLDGHRLRSPSVKWVPSNLHGTIREMNG